MFSIEMIILYFCVEFVVAKLLARNKVEHYVGFKFLQPISIDEKLLF